MTSKLRAFLTGVGSPVDLDGRATRRRLQEPPGSHPFFDRCPHGVQFLDECEACPDGWQPDPRDEAAWARHQPAGD